MKTVFISDNTISELILAKKEIDDLTGKPGVPIQDFISSLDFTSHIFMTGGTPVPFARFSAGPEDFIFVVGASDTPGVKALMSALDGIGYDYSSLKDVNPMEFLSNPETLRSTDLFIIDGKYKKV